jgi:hypothetical protein
MTINEFINFDKTFRYQLLSRLKEDCNYYLHNGNRNPENLWADNEKRQIQFMLALYNSFSQDEKPEWLTLEQIKGYKAKMIK